MISHKTGRFYFFLACSIFIGCLRLNAQQYALGDFTLVDAPTWYDSTLSQQNSGVILGEYYPLEKKSLNFHPFFESDSWQDAVVSYRDKIYRDVSALYDIHNDIVVFRHPDPGSMGQPVQPNQDQVKWFKINDHFFRYIPTPVLQFDPGFLEVLYDGDELDLLAKRTKVDQVETEGLIYVSGNRYLVCLNGSYYPVKGKRSFLKLFKSHKKSIRSFVRDNNLTIKSRSESGMARLAEFCDSLKTEDAL